MLQWMIGEATITRIPELEMVNTYFEKRPFMRPARPEAVLPIKWLQPHFVTPEGGLRWAIQSMLVEAPGVRLIVDTCVGNDRPRKIIGGRAHVQPFLERLAEAGWTRESVTHVVCTHLHVDHVGWNTMLHDGAWVPTFPNARYLISAAEYAHWRAEPDEENQTILADAVQPIIDAGLLELVELDHRISPEIRLMPTPGHTPGHVSVKIKSAGQAAIITGDIMHHPCQIAHPEWETDFDTDRAAATAVRQQFVCDVVDKPVLVIGTHFAAPTAGHIVRDGDSYRLIF